ncbi:MAG: hypothetical protein AAGJ31_09060 [Verrucomicrobiota bacterium]
MREIHEIDTLEDYLNQGRDLRGCVIQGLDLRGFSWNWDRALLRGAVFLGCQFSKNGEEVELVERGAALFPPFPNLPYCPYRPKLYTREELAEGKPSLDEVIYEHFVKRGRDQPDVYEALSQRLHDHAIDDGLQDLLEGRLDGGKRKRVVAIMGGHGVPRTDPFFEKVARISRSLTKKGYFIASGGGPGIMEAANFGAWMSETKEAEFREALGILHRAAVYTDEGYLDAAREVVARHPQGGASVAIPTWFYGHEPSNLFSTFIAKYFSNSIREDGLLAIAKHGVIYAPGSAGTTQEVFMDACQNHYGTFHHVSPMIFLGRSHYLTKTRIFPTLRLLAEGRQYAEHLHVTDDPRKVIRWITEYKLTEYKN